MGDASCEMVDGILVFPLHHTTLHSTAVTSPKPLLAIQSQRYSAVNTPTTTPHHTIPHYTTLHHITPHHTTPHQHTIQHTTYALVTAARHQFDRHEVSRHEFCLSVCLACYTILTFTLMPAVLLQPPRTSSGMLTLASLPNPQALP
jgi:hypothetical protein